MILGGILTELFNLIFLWIQSVVLRKFFGCFNTFSLIDEDFLKQGLFFQIAFNK